jgi:hypothetical protein
MREGKFSPADGHRGPWSATRSTTGTGVEAAQVDQMGDARPGTGSLARTGTAVTSGEHLSRDSTAENRRRRHTTPVRHQHSDQDRHGTHPPERHRELSQSQPRATPRAPHSVSFALGNHRHPVIRTQLPVRRPRQPSNPTGQTAVNNNGELLQTNRRSSTELDTDSQRGAQHRIGQRHLLDTSSNLRQRDTLHT